MQVHVRRRPTNTSRSSCITWPGSPKTGDLAVELASQLLADHHRACFLSTVAVGPGLLPGLRTSSCDRLGITGVSPSTNTRIRVPLLWMAGMDFPHMYFRKRHQLIHHNNSSNSTLAKLVTSEKTQTQYLLVHSVLPRLI